MNRIKKLTALILAITFLCICNTGLAEDERKEGYFVVYEKGTNNKIFSTARILHVGDKYLNEENKLYEIVEISGDKAYAEFKEIVDINQSLNTGTFYKEKNAETGERVIDISSSKERIVAIYHTHSDESYIPTDGKSSIPNKGGIFKVGNALQNALEEKGIKAIQSEQSHDPHDSSAYQRSRRTAVELLKNGPDAIIDLHRDAVPAEEYKANINGESITKFQIVVGRQNPQMSTTDNFAKQIKSTADEKYPGLIKGIFYGKGSYNQDLSPRSILLEAGTYTNSRYDAQEGASLMADVIATTLYGEDYDKQLPLQGGQTSNISGEGGSASKALLWILGITALGFGAYMLISTGGLNELSAKLKRFSGREFANFLGGKLQLKDEGKDRKNTDEEKDDNEK